MGLNIFFTATGQPLKNPLCTVENPPYEIYYPIYTSEMSTSSTAYVVAKTDKLFVLFLLARLNFYN